MVPTAKEPSPIPAAAAGSMAYAGRDAVLNPTAAKIAVPTAKPRTLRPNRVLSVICNFFSFDQAKEV
jgi:hypothetical protein